MENSLLELSFEQLKRYVGVSFGKQNDVIPRKWISEWSATNKECKYPKETKKAARLCQLNAEPSSKWKSYKINLLCHSSK